MPITILVGTVKGGFLLRSQDRAAWTVEGPLFKGWKVTTARNLGERTLLATASDVYGPAIHVSEDLSEWRQVENGPTWPQGGERKTNQIWTIAAPPDEEGDGSGANGRIYAGIDEAGLFASDDRGETWSPVEGLNDHETRSAWYPGAGGLCAHAILLHPQAPERVWCGISAVGVFRSDDGGLTWTPKNEGVPAVIEDKVHKTIGRCVHGLAQDPDDPDRIWRREHNGMFRSQDGGDTWQRIEEGLPSWFGFPVAIDPRTRALYVVPLESDEYRMPTDGRLAVYRSSDGGDSWQACNDGLPTHPTYAGILRGALDVDGQDPCGVYFGTTAGAVHASADGGESWSELPCTLPRILSVRVLEG